MVYLKLSYIISMIVIDNQYLYPFLQILIIP
nr:hypothetical protein TDPV-009 [Oriental turtle dovepox virus]